VHSPIRKRADGEFPACRTGWHVAIKKTNYKQMKNKTTSSKNEGKEIQNQAKIEEDKNSFPDYPAYPSDEDIYSQYKEEEEVNPEYPSKIKESNEKRATRNIKDFEEDMTGSDLDVPGSELDDDQEVIGSEDEENNYYSLGGDNHDDLEEDQGD
jgi:hypothetical protein